MCTQCINWKIPIVIHYHCHSQYMNTPGCQYMSEIIMAMSNNIKIIRIILKIKVNILK